MSCKFCNSDAPSHTWCSCPEAIEQYKTWCSNRPKAEDIDFYNQCTTSAEDFTDACFEWGDSQCL